MALGPGWEGGVDVDLHLGGAGQQQPQYERGHDHGAGQRHQAPPGEHGQGSEHRLSGDKREDRPARGHPRGRQAVGEVVLASEEHRPAMADPVDHHGARVQHGQGKEQQRHHETAGRRQ